MKEYIKKRMYKWHRIFGLLVLIPTLLWTLSGLMHPFMSHWFKSRIPNRMFPIESVSISDSIVPVYSILQKNGIDTIQNIRFLQWNNKSYYQIKDKYGMLHYFDRSNGNKLAFGDQKYAELIARYILEDSISSVKSMTLLTDYTSEYKSINRLLPVWKVSFDRNDQMDVYVETEYSKFSSFNDRKQKVFVWIFSCFHNWDFLSFIENRYVQIFLMLFFIGLLLLSSLSGIIIYVFHWKYFKKPKGEDKLGKVKRMHRLIGISFSLFSLMFAFSGGYHLIQKFNPDRRHEAFQQNHFAISEKLNTIPSLIKEKTLQGIVQIRNETYIQTIEHDTFSQSLNFEFFHLNTGNQLKNGTEKYTYSLLQKYCSQNKEKVKLLTPPIIQRDYSPNYGFVNKRLPVMLYQLDNSDHSCYYIEPATGQLAAYINKAAVREGFSFAFLHKFHFLDGLGKNIRDVILVGFASVIAITSILGLCVFYRKI
jgi:hypothetical protein